MMFKSLFTFVLLGISASAYAQGASPVHQASLVHQHESVSPHSSPRIFEVNIKAIGASDSESFSVDSRIEELAPKLRRLPFGAFKLQSDTTDEISLLSRHRISLSNGQSICIRPVDSTDSQITMWLKWKGDDGMSILDTRVNFALNETMIVGIEGQSDSAGTVLAISVSPKS